MRHASTNSKQRRIGMLSYIGRRSYAYAGYFSISDGYILDRVSISVVDMVDMSVRLIMISFDFKFLRVAA